MKKVDLTLLNRLVKELNTQVALAENIDPTSHNHDHVVELSKAIGLASAISSESMMLMGDIAGQAKPANVPSANEDLFTSLFGSKKKVS